METSTPISMALPRSKLRIAGQLYMKDESLPVLVGLHGWVDNIATWHEIGPALVKGAPYNLLVVDLPGHGRSDWLPDTYLVYSAEVYLTLCREILQAASARWGLGKSVALMGHSMGGHIAVLLAAAFPELVHELVLIEASGMATEQATKFVSTIQAGVKLGESQAGLPRSVYPSLQAAIDRRVSAPGMYPGGRQTISRVAAQRLVEYGSDVTADGKVHFFHDQRIKGRQIFSATEEQMRTVLSAIQCPVLYVGATDGFHRYAAAKFKPRLALIANLTQVILPGSHHLHADPETAQPVAEAISSWLAGQLRPALGAGKPGAAASSGNRSIAMWMLVGAAAVGVILFRTMRGSKGGQVR